jgi:Flp pilus assembly protein TadG
MKILSILGRRSRNRRRGGVTVEAALVLPVIITFLFGIMEYGRYLMMLQILTNAAREGARYAVTHTNPITISSVTYGNNDTDVTNAVNTALAGTHLNNQTISFYTSDSLGNNLGSWTNTQTGQSICVRISGNYPVILGRMLFMPTSIPVVA